MRCALPFLAAAALLVLGVPLGSPFAAQALAQVLAQDGVHALSDTQSARFQKRGSARTPQIDCTCRYRGRDIAVGDAVCMAGRLARCEMVLNNTSWSFTKDVCPIASLGTDEAQGMSFAGN